MALLFTDNKTSNFVHNPETTVCWWGTLNHVGFGETHTHTYIHTQYIFFLF